MNTFVAVIQKFIVLEVDALASMLKIDKLFLFVNFLSNTTFDNPNIQSVNRIINEPSHLLLQNNLSQNVLELKTNETRDEKCFIKVKNIPGLNEFDSSLNSNLIKTDNSSGLLNAMGNSSAVVMNSNNVSNSNNSSALKMRRIITTETVILFVILLIIFLGYKSFGSRRLVTQTNSWNVYTITIF